MQLSLLILLLAVKHSRQTDSDKDISVKIDDYAPCELVENGVFHGSFFNI